jgi:Tfp pilus tip-associated adhesin PilY1
MKNIERTARTLGAAAFGMALALTPPKLVKAEDIDLFVSAASIAATNPNILIILDNSANWNSAAQHWPTPVGETGVFKQGESELRAIKAVLGDLDGTNPRVNLGLMMLRSGAPDGGILRYAIRPMDTTNIKGFQELIGAATGCSGTNSVNGTPNCVLQNFSGTGVEQTNNIDYSALLFDAYKYFGGYTSPPYAQLNQQPPGATNDATHYGAPRYFDNTGSATLNARMDALAYTADGKSYVSPIASPCAKNYIILIGNGIPSQDAAGPLIANVNTGASPALPTQISVPTFTLIPTPSTTTLGIAAACQTPASCASAAAAAFPGQYDSYSCTGGNTVSNATVLGTDAACETAALCAIKASTLFPSPPNSYTSYSCSGGIGTGDTFAYNVCSTQAACEAAGPTVFPGLAPGDSTYSCSNGGSNCGTGGAKSSWTMTRTVIGCAAPNRKGQTELGIDGSITACNAPNLVDQTMKGTKTVNVVTPGDTFCTPGTPGCTGARYPDEWARLLYTTDVSPLLGQQNVTVYTIDVFKDHQDPDETALLFNMAKYGGGRYFQATNEESIISALRQVMIEVQSVNSVFASASLPINATNRSQNENQVFIGMFRPDPTGNPRWYGNLKRYQIARFGNDFKLADASNPPQEAVSTTGQGFVQPCATSFWTVDSGPYWLFQNGSAGQCTTAGTSAVFSDAPDGPLVEKGAVSEVLRRGNAPPTSAGVQSPLPGVNRNLYTCATSASCCPGCGTAQETTLVDFDATNVSKAQLGDASMADLRRDNIINFTRGLDIDDKNTNASTADVRPSVHGDVAHSRPLPVNYGTGTGVVLFYGANDGTFRAVQGSDGKELWAFLAPEHHAKLARLTDNSPPILYPNQVSPPANATSKDYFFDGSAGLFQNADNSKVWVFPSMRRGGRMLYAFDVTTATKPSMKWKAGCDETGTCTAGFEQMGQTWSTPAVALVKGFSAGDADKPLIIVGGGYDDCEDEDAVPNTKCDPSVRIGNRVYIIDANTGTRLKEFTTNGSVPADITLVDRDFDGLADQAYVADTLGSIYRIDFVDPVSLASLDCTGPDAACTFRMTEVARTTGANRKFLFPPAALPSANKVYLAFASGDRERPLIVNYPYPAGINPGVLNRAYMLIDNFSTAGLPLDLDGASFTDLSAGSSCSTPSVESQGQRGWFINLSAGASSSSTGAGEQAVTSTAIFGGLVFFSTNRPLPTPPGACENKLGEANGYALNLLNASGAADTLNICGGARSATFLGGGLPPSPVTGTVPVGAQGAPVTVMIGGVQRGGGTSSSIGAQRVTPSITQRRARLYWYTDGDK